MKVLRLCFAEAQCGFTDLTRLFARTHLKYLLNMPDSIKVALGIEQLRTGNLLFDGLSRKSVSNVRVELVPFAQIPKA